MKNIYQIVLMFFVQLVVAQNVSISGKVISSNGKLPIESATVYISKAQDSTLIDYTITDKSGAFLISTRKISEDVLLRISSVGLSEFTKDYKEFSQNIDLGIIELDDLPQGIDEIVIKAKAPPIRIKKDTLEFDAASFKVRPDANVETLLKQLPGVEIDEEGKITVNGKEVNEILVNGKPFFDKDGKIALQNLPAEIVNKVQVSDTKTKIEKKTGESSKSNNSSINITIDEDKNQGFFGKFMGGYGTNDRYESSLLMNYFKGAQKISLLASSNNINSTGFSMDEIFDNMGGGRSRSVSIDGNGGFNVGGRSFGGGRGITQSNIVGLNFSDEFVDGLDFSSSYFYSNSNSENTNKTKQTNLLPTGNFVSNSESNTISENNGHSIKADVEYDISDKLSVGITPNFTTGKSITRNNYLSNSEDENGRALNDSEGFSVNESTSNNFSNELFLTKNFDRKGRHLSFSLNNSNSKNDGLDFQNSINRFYKDTDGNGINDETSIDARNQRTNSLNNRDRYEMNLTFTEKVLDSTSLNIGVDVSQEINKDRRSTFDFDPITGNFTQENELLSDNLFFKNNKVEPSIGLHSNTSKYFFNVNMGTSITRLDYQSQYVGIDTQVQRQYLYPSFSMNANYRFTKSKSLYLNYNYDYDFATAREILPIENLANAMNTIIGNENLSPTKSHNFYLSFRDYNFTTKSGYDFYIGGNLNDANIVSISSFDDSRKRTTTYTNVDGVNNFWMGTSWNKSVKRDAHSYRYSVGLSGSIDNNIGFTDQERYKALSYRISPRLRFNYDYGEVLSIAPSYNLTFRNTEYTNYIIDERSNVSHNFNLQITNYWPKNIVFGNDFGYTYNSNISDGFKKDFYLWNTSLGYNFLNKTLLAKVKVYDVLNQNISTTNSISATAITDQENTVLRRYAMFSLTYKLEQFAAKKQIKDGENRSRGRRR